MACRHNGQTACHLQGLNLARLALAQQQGRLVFQSRRSESASMEALGAQRSPQQLQTTRIGCRTRSLPRFTTSPQLLRASNHLE